VGHEEEDRLSLIEEEVASHHWMKNHMWRRVQKMKTCWLHWKQCSPKLARSGENKSRRRKGRHETKPKVHQTQYAPVWDPGFSVPIGLVAQSRWTQSGSRREEESVNMQRVRTLS
jgi:hypothetical protein